MASKNFLENDKTNLEVKYRPTGLDELIGQDNFLKKAMNWVYEGNIPHLLFVGPPGVGKTSAAEVLARELFGENNWSIGLIKYNAADFRGIDTVRGSITKDQITGTVWTKFKIILLDEVDAMTNEAQEALKTKMEKYTNNAKFILVCNDEDRIIRAIKNRCTVIYFNRIKEEDIVKRLKDICDEEKITYSPGALEKIAKISDGTLRKAIRDLTVYKDFSNHINEEDIDSDKKTLEFKNIKNLIDKALECDIQACDRLLFQLYNMGSFNVKDILNQSFEIIRDDKQLAQSLKYELIEQIGIYEARIDQGSDELLQVRCFLSSLGYCKLKSQP